MAKFRSAIAGFLVATILLFTLGACGIIDGETHEGQRHITNPPASTGHYAVTSVTLPSGKTVECIAVETTHRGGLDCDWDGAWR